MTYTGGNSKRQVDVEFVYDAKATKPVYTFVSENPMLHYVSGQSSQKQHDISWLESNSIIYFVASRLHNHSTFY